MKLDWWWHTEISQVYKAYSLRFIARVWNLLIIFFKVTLNTQKFLRHWTIFMSVLHYPWFRREYCLFSRGLLSERNGPIVWGISIALTRFSILGGGGQLPLTSVLWQTVESIICNVFPTPKILPYNSLKIFNM